MLARPQLTAVVHTAPFPFYTCTCCTLSPGTNAQCRWNAPGLLHGTTWIKTEKKKQCKPRLHALFAGLHCSVHPFLENPWLPRLIATLACSRAALLYTHPFFAKRWLPHLIAMQGGAGVLQGCRPFLNAAAYTSSRLLPPEPDVLPEPSTHFPLLPPMALPQDMVALVTELHGPA
ncbi:hypothetical protein DUNSADRAFT_17806 [Dunaliella salina]|uniref:Encoded protein n=1 Tax=Dunaliella salina TaxID=3046 RepID=A0ABQ7GZM8_DUNSA|nr:hypothetical protein DUNSADRAFT_17806 [Dunaliella salina]|eukprot:KAF5840071.1 hypothetical protein DUNSADRAFT_17806 [Dunaliella salina]